MHARNANDPFNQIETRGVSPMTTKVAVHSVSEVTALALEHNTIWITARGSVISAEWVNPELRYVDLQGRTLELELVAESPGPKPVQIGEIVAAVAVGPLEGPLPKHVCVRASINSIEVRVVHER